MNKLIFKKILFDYLRFFTITIISASVIVWVFQAVNYLDIMIEDGKSYFTYISFSFLNLPKIVSRLFPFVLFFSFFYVLIRYENNNELLIFWNFGVNKFDLIKFFFYFSFVLTIFQILLTSLVVPNTLKYSRDLMKNSNIDLFEGFIKPKKFNDTIKGLTIYSEDEKENGELVNIYIKKDTGSNSYQITYAKNGRLKVGINNVLQLINGETINSINGKISKFKFETSDFGLNNLETNVLQYDKLQETKTLILFSCLNILFKKDIVFLNNINLSDSSHNCSFENLGNIYKELYKRYIIPLYIPILLLVTLILIFKSKEYKFYPKLKIIIFLTNFFIIILSEASLKFINNNFYINYTLILIPIIFILCLILNFIYQLKTRFKTL
jgi:lipopolysaccharide export system permease protein